MVASRALTGRPHDLLPELEQRVLAEVGNRKVRKFYLGRTSTLDDPGGAQGRDAAIVLYETASLRNALEVEEALVRRLIAHVKSWNHCGNVSRRPSSRRRERVSLALWHQG